MKLKAKILPKYFEQIKAGDKKVDYRQFKSIVFINIETGEEMEYKIYMINDAIGNQQVIRGDHPDVFFDTDMIIYGISLGERIR